MWINLVYGDKIHLNGTAIGIGKKDDKFHFSTLICSPLPTTWLAVTVLKFYTQPLKLRLRSDT